MSSFHLDWYFMFCPPGYRILVFVYTFRFPSHFLSRLPSTSEYPPIFTPFRGFRKKGDRHSFRLSPNAAKAGGFQRDHHLPGGRHRCRNRPCPPGQCPAHRQSYAAAAERAYRPAQSPQDRRGSCCESKQRRRQNGAVIQPCPDSCRQKRH